MAPSRSATAVALPIALTLYTPQVKYSKTCDGDRAWSPRSMSNVRPTVPSQPGGATRNTCGETPPAHVTVASVSPGLTGWPAQSLLHVMSLILDVPNPDGLVRSSRFCD